MFHGWAPVVEEAQFCEKGAFQTLDLCKSTHLIISNPHFLFDTNEMPLNVNGFNAQQSLHETYIDVEPVSLHLSSVFFFSMLINDHAFRLFADDRRHNQRQQKNAVQRVDSKSKQSVQKDKSDDHFADLLGGRGTLFMQISLLLLLLTILICPDVE
jgi:hypothetical protein